MFGMVVIAACTNAPSPSKDDAAAAMAAVVGGLETAQFNAVGAAVDSNQQPPYTLDLDYSGPCALGGSAAVKGLYVSGDGAHFSNDFTMNQCHDELGTLDGVAHEDASTVGVAGAFSVTGAFVYSPTYGNRVECDFDLLAAVDTTTKAATFTGTACGWDVTTFPR